MPLPQSLPLLALDYQITRISSALYPALHICSLATVPLVLPSSVAYGFCLSLLRLVAPASCPGSKALFSLPVLKHQVDVCLVRCVLFVLVLFVWELGAWGPTGDWRFQVTLFSGPSILQAPGERFPLGGSRFQGCHGYLPSGLRLLLPANLLGTSSQAHLFVMSLNVAKYNLGKVRLEGMQSAVHISRYVACGAARWRFAGLFGSCCLSYAFLLVDLCGSLALFSESLRILAPSRPSRLVGGSLGKYGSGKLFSTDYSV